jgi:hypothetical protein
MTIAAARCRRFLRQQRPGANPADRFQRFGADALVA